ncbi:MAG TPA: NAD(P)/FAD-dependent oxidoreductase [Flexivirga sp.]|uniref:flavin-containing monooxygenase n=1 Tax=Flexivirga sp. TaxID=1962927 RepID=UPI002BD8E7BB|nr:NAD(P)/FAD-dependent oxidoreductase [Flexivirga sp.]HWC21183.1 NAD(P)/FAD-dependent oxidoreductase [Flexivirga sp.]
MTAPTVPTLRRDVVVIGAGQAGLSASHFLRKAGLQPGVDFDVLDANPTPGGAWSHRWDALTLGAVHGIHDLPDFPLGTPDPTEPAREVVKRYYGAYERHEDLRVQRPWKVTSVEDAGEPLLVRAERDGERRDYLADAVISATGTWDRPYVPRYPGRFAGIQLTTRDFGAPQDFEGKRVLVVGGGASAVQFLLLLERYGVSTVWSTRRPPQWIDRRVDPKWGAEVERRVAAKTRAGLPAGSVVSNTGLLRNAEYEAGIARGTLVSRGGIARLTDHGVDFTDGSHEDVDAILWATGFRASLGHLTPLKLREPGGGVRMAPDDVSVVKEPRLFVVGYGPSASTLGATRAGRRAARGALRVIVDRAAA